MIPTSIFASRQLVSSAARNCSAKGSSRRPPLLVANIAGCLLKLGSGLKQLDTREQKVTYDH